MKLVRNKVPELMRLQGKEPKVHVANDAEFEEYLLKKLDEEVLEAKKSCAIEELADILEVVNTIAQLRGVSPTNLRKMQKSKANQNGTFSKKIILENHTP